MYHLFVLLNSEGIDIAEIEGEFERRNGI
ncbi:hypothetical protein HY604_04705 [Candidatus Peregrinibacteria bacterium]|nr:hypothetical protein [Candidatus Peregrinibacteria bacterium]